MSVLKYYNTGTSSWETAIVGAQGATGPGFVSKGEWSDLLNYAVNDVVTYNGSSYVCIFAVSSGTDVAPYPQNIGSYWNLIAAKGDNGNGGSALGDRITSGTFEVIVGSDGTLNLPISDALYNTALVQSTVPIAINSNGSFFKFHSDGYLEFPNGSRILNDEIGFSVTLPSNGPGGTSSEVNSLTVGIANPAWADAILANPSGHYIQFNWDDYTNNFPISGISGPAPGTNVYTLTGTWAADGGAFPIVIASNDYVANVTTIKSDTGLKINTQYGNEWLFDKDGLLTLPNGASIGSSGSLSGIPMTTDRGTVLFGNSPECVPTLLTHFHIMKDDPANVDLFFGDDNNYVKLPGSGETAYGVEIGTNVGSAYTWRFGTDGILNFPNNNGQIGQLESPYTGLEFRTGSGADWIGISYGEINDNNTSYFYFDKDGSDYTTANHRAHLQIKSPEQAYGASHLEWLFDADGNLTIPHGGKLGFDLLAKHEYGAIALQSLGGVGTYAAIASPYSFVQVRDNEVEIQSRIDGETTYNWTFGADGNLTIPGGITKDGETLTLTVGGGSFTSATLGVLNPTTDFIIGSENQGLGIQQDGTTVLQSKFDSGAPLVLIGGNGASAGQDGGGVGIYGGGTLDSNLGGVDIQGQYLDILTTDGVHIGAPQNNGWTFDNTDFGLVFPDETTQYTAWQGSTIVSNTAPSDDLGRIWFNSVDGRAYIKYNDLWTDLSPIVVPDPTTYLDGLTINGTTISPVDSTGTVSIQTGLDTKWTFGTDGNLTFPNGDLTIGQYYDSPAIVAAAGKNIGLVSSGVGDGYEVGSSLIWVDSITEPTKIAGVVANDPFYVGAGDVGIVTGDYFYTGTTNVWNFGADGSLAFPTAGVSFDYFVPTIIGKDQISFSTYDAGNSTSSYAVSTQDNKTWEAFAEDDETGAHAAWAWIKAELPTVDTPEVFIENKKGVDGIGLRWTFGADGILTIPDTGDILRNDISVFRTRWDATPTVPGNNCPIFAELTPDHFYAYTQRSHIELDNDGHWYIGSNANATGLYGLDHDTTLYSNFGNVVIRTGENDLKYFTFDSNGSLTFPDDTTQTTAWQGSVLISDTAPDNDLGRIWFNSVDGRAYVKYNDLWADLSPIIVPNPEVYLEGLTIEGTTIGVLDATATQVVNFDAELAVNGNIEPADNLVYNLGSPTRQWNALYVSSSTIYMSGRALSLTNEGLQIDGGTPVSVIDGGDASTWLTAI